MNETEIFLLCGNDRVETERTLRKFIQENEKVNNFPMLTKNGKRKMLWGRLFEIIEDPSHIGIHALGFQSIRILSRDTTQLDEIITEKEINFLIQKACLDAEASNIRIEAIKCLCNICYNSKTAREMTVKSQIIETINENLKTYRDMKFTTDIQLFEMKLLFILTAFLSEARSQVLNSRGVELMSSALNQTFINENGSREITEMQCFVSCEILKTLFNVLSFSKLIETKIFEYLVPILRKILLHKAANEELTFELHNNTANLLTSVADDYYYLLTPESHNEQMSEKYFHYRGKDCEALDQLLKLLQTKLNQIKNPNGMEMLTPILSILIRAARADRVNRKYLRNKILPPLKEVHTRPEVGERIRNKICRLLTDVNTQVRDLAAELIFILCKQNINRVIKYTGFGNAAGLLAQKGLLGGQTKSDSSTDEESDTEEYLEAKPDINPVVGCTGPQIPNPFEGMSDEQKEYEAMKLVNLMQKLISSGLVKPARVGADGRPESVEHVMQFREDQKGNK